jgi:hypothetical protein
VLTVILRLVELEIENAESEVALEIENAEAEVELDNGDSEARLVILPFKRSLEDRVRILWSRMNVPGDALYAREFDE